MLKMLVEGLDEPQFIILKKFGRMRKLSDKMMFCLFLTLKRKKMKQITWSDNNLRKTSRQIIKN